MGPLTFAGVRYLLGGMLVLPLAIWEKRADRRSCSAVANGC